MGIRAASAKKSAIGNLLLIAVAMLLAVLIFAFASKIIWHAQEISPAKILIEDATPGSLNITVVHMGGGKIEDAFASDTPEYFLDGTVFNKLEVRINGEVHEGWGSLNCAAITKPDFETADELELGLRSPLSFGDTVCVVCVPTEQTLAEVVVR